MPRSMYWIFGLLVLVAGIIGVAVAVFLGLQEGRFRSEGVTTPGTIVDREYEEDSEGDVSFYLIYEFQPSFGGTVEGRGEVDEGAYEAVSRGDLVEIEYVPGDPSMNRLSGSGGWAGPVIVGVMGGVAVPIGGVLTAVAWHRTRTHRRLMREGITAPAVVVAHEQTSYSVNDQPQWLVLYQYTDAVGRTFHGKSDYMAWHEAMRWHVGSPVTVRYDPGRPEESVWVGPLG